MAEFTSYEPGTPCWIDAGTTDMAGARDFYGRLLGWTFEEGPPETGGYTLTKLRGRTIGGLMTLTPEQREQGIPPAWTTYFATNDVDGSAKLIRDAGGAILAEPMDVMDLGRMLIASDPTDAVFGLWQANQFAGSELANEPGTLVWSELVTNDTARARDFYSAVLSYGAEDVAMDDGPPYVTWQLDGRIIGGMKASTDQMPARWTTYFAVADTDATVAAAQEAGGQVFNAPQDTPYGRMAVLADPVGAGFSVIQVAPDQ